MDLILLFNSQFLTGIKGFTITGGIAILDTLGSYLKMKHLI